MKHKRVVVQRRGGPDVLQVVEEDLPEPQPGEVRVKVLAAGVSAFDLMVRRPGWFPGIPRVPFTPGGDIVGVVDKLGEGESTVESGQTVAGGAYSLGGYAEFICLPASDLVPVPSGLDPAQAVCLVVNYLTAHLALHETARRRSGERILVHGAAGGVGTALLQLGEDFVQRIRSLTGDGVDVVFDPIGGARQLWRSYRALCGGGRLLWIGVAATSKKGMRVIPLSLLAAFLLKLIPDGKEAPWFADIGKFAQTHNAWYRETLTALLELLAAGTIKPVVAERIPLVEAARAHELLERGGYAGKVVLVASA